jgi:hypothetical protein
VSVLGLIEQLPAGLLDGLETRKANTHSRFIFAPIELLAFHGNTPTEGFRDVENIIP